MTLHYIKFTTLHYITLHYNTLHALHALHYITLHYITLHRITSHYIDYISPFFRKFSQLPRFDQYNVAAKSLSILNNLKRTRPSEYGVCSALPSVQQLSLVIDLYEVANDVQGVVDLITDLIYPREVGYVGIFAPQTSAVKGTMPNKLAYVVAVIRKHYTIILTSTEQTITIFKG